MAFFNEFPNTRSYDSDLGWCIAAIEQIINKLGGFDQITFADPITWSITTQYSPFVIVREGADGGLYISKKPVPAGIALSNTEYWESLGVYDTKSDVIINVADYGAIGVNGADYTAQLTEAFAAGNIIYFPEGTYSFGTIAVNKPLYIFGAGAGTVWKPLHRTEFSNQYKTMLQSSNDLTIDNINFVGDNSIVSQTGDKYYQTAMIQQYGARFVMRRCFINDIYDDYHLSQGDLEFYARNGLLLYVSDADYAEISDCTFGSYGGEELIWISRAVAKFGDNVDVIIRSNRFLDRVSIAGGGTLDGGSAINVLGGNVSFHNNTGNNYYERGSAFNLLGNNVDISDNVFTDCNMSSWCDCCEGYYGKAESVYVHDNYVDDKNGVTTYSVKAQAVNINISNNHLEGAAPIKTYNAYDPSLLSYQLYTADAANWTKNEAVTICNNELILTMDASNYANSGIALHQSPAPSGSRGEIAVVQIKDNIIKAAAGLTAFYTTINLSTRAALLQVENNIFPYAGTGVPSASYGSYIEVADTAAAGNAINILRNTFNDAAFANVRVLQVLAANISILTVLAAYNVAVTTGSNYFANANFANISGDYNIGFTALK